MAQDTAGIAATAIPTSAASGWRSVCPGSSTSALRWHAGTSSASSSPRSDSWSWQASRPAAAAVRREGPRSTARRRPTADAAPPRGVDPAAPPGAEVPSPCRGPAATRPLSSARRRIGAQVLDGAAKPVRTNERTRHDQEHGSGSPSRCCSDSSTASRWRSPRWRASSGRRSASSSSARSAASSRWPPSCRPGGRETGCRVGGLDADHRPPTDPWSWTEG